jgi:hypothetical protein
MMPVKVVSVARNREVLGLLLMKFSIFVRDTLGFNPAISASDVIRVLCGKAPQPLVCAARQPQLLAFVTQRHFDYK